MAQLFAYSRRMKRQDWLQAAFALASGATAFVLWTAYQVDFRADALAAAARTLAADLADWVHRTRAMFR